MNYIDIIIIALVALTIVVGYFRGFTRALINFFNSVVKFFVAYWLAKPFANLLGKIFKFDDNLHSSLRDWASGLSSKFNENLVGLSQDELNQKVSEGLSDAKLPKLFRGVFNSLFNVSTETINSYENITIADMMANAMTRVIMIVLAFVVLYLILTLLVFILKFVTKRRIKASVILQKTDRRLGALVGLVKSFVNLFIIFAVLYFFRNASWLSGFFDAVNTSFLGKPLSRLVFSSVENYFNIKSAVAVI